MASCICTSGIVSITYRYSRYLHQNTRYRIGLVFTGITHPYYNWGEPERAPHYRGLREHVHRPTDRPGDQPTDRPTDRPCPSHSRDTETLHVPTLPSRHATTHVRHVNSALRSGDSYKTENADDGKAKAETPAQRTARLERERDQRTLHTCASLSVSPCILGFHVRQFFSPVTSHKPLFTLPYISTTCARTHCILDKTLIWTRNAYAGVHRPHPLA